MATLPSWQVARVRSQNFWLALVVPEAVMGRPALALAVAPESLLGPGAGLRLLLGLWWPEGGWPRLRALLLAAITLASISLLVAGVALKLYMDTPQELEEFAFCGLVALVCVGFLIKDIVFIMEGSTLLRLVTRLSVMRSEYGGGESSESKRRRYMQISERMYRYFQAMAIPAVTCWVCVPLVSSVMTSADEISTEQRRQFPLPAWVPTSFDASPTYEILYVIQSAFAMITAESTVCTDIFFFNLMLMVAAELEILNDCIAAMQESRSKTQGSKDEQDTDALKRI
ncbi:uncharacterized protein LOC126413912 [Schistocerca serialis cubense]|uniref:uncharacterized protein LOC126413912 n=1 Tax=Schistocerca serialis cubense TaxID=2023355 RepID=UPI00214EFE18|nr:uncharacterized protein LOC126413912 [Schistocerca serialis cubense]